jgi:hypothetical protein
MKPIGPCIATRSGLPSQKEPSPGLRAAIIEPISGKPEIGWHAIRPLPRAGEVKSPRWLHVTRTLEAHDWCLCAVRRFVNLVNSSCAEGTWVPRVWRINAASRAPSRVSRPAVPLSTAAAIETLTQSRTTSHARFALLLQAISNRKAIPPCTPTLGLVTRAMSETIGRGPWLARSLPGTAERCAHSQMSARKSWR